MSKRELRMCSHIHHDENKRTDVQSVRTEQVV